MRRAYDEPQINLTPLIDVVFVILIMFIVIAPLLDIDQIQLADSGDQTAHTSAQESEVAIHVQADNTIMINRQHVPTPQLAGRLTQLHTKYPEARAQVFHDKRAAFGTYQNVKNALESAGFQEMDIVLAP